MKRIITTSLLLCLLTIHFSANSQQIIDTPQSKSLITIADIILWLKSDLNPNTPYQNSFIQKVLISIDTSKKFVETINRNEYLIMVPLMGDHFSQHIKKDDHVLSFLLLVEDPNHKIRRGDLAFFYAKDSTLKSLPPNSFHDFFNSEDISVDGTFSLISLGDVKFYEMDFLNGEKIKFKLWVPKKSQKQNCSDWTLHITDYNDFHRKQDLDCITHNSIPLGTSCNDCPPGFVCDNYTLKWEQ